MNSVQANVTPAAQCEQANDARNTAGCIGIFGSAFDPPHQGHRDVLAQCIDRFQRIILIPSFSHAFGKQMTPYSQRLELLEAFRQSSGFANKLSISTVEQDLAQPDAPVYSWDLMEYLEGELQTWHSNVALTLIVGPDNAAPDTSTHLVSSIRRASTSGVIVAFRRRTRGRGALNRPGRLDPSPMVTSPVLTLHGRECEIWRMSDGEVRFLGGAPEIVVILAVGSTTD